MRNFQDKKLSSDGTATFGSGVKLRDASAFLKRHGRAFIHLPGYGMWVSISSFQIAEHFKFYAGKIAIFCGKFPRPKNRGFNSGGFVVHISCNPKNARNARCKKAKTKRKYFNMRHLATRSMNHSGEK